MTPGVVAEKLRQARRDVAPETPRVGTATKRTGSGAVKASPEEDREKASEPPPARKSEPPAKKAEAKKSEPPAKKAEAEPNKSEPPAKKVEVVAKQSEPPAKKPEIEAKKSEPPGKKAEIDAKKSEPPTKKSGGDTSHRPEAKQSEPPGASERPSAVVAAKRRSSSAAPDRLESSPPSGPHSLSESGVSNTFFASLPLDLPPSEPPPESEEAPVYLTRDQIERRQKNKKLVMMIIGAVGALGFFAVLGPRLFGTREEPKKPTTSATTAAARPTASASAKPTASAIETPTATPTPTVTATAEASAETSAAPADSANPEEDLPDVPDPLKEAMTKLNIGAYAEAIKFSKAAIKKDPENADGYFALFTAYESVGNLAEAKKARDACGENATKGQYKGYCPPKKK
jgi:hypothetical protein